MGQLRYLIWSVLGRPSHGRPVDASWKTKTASSPDDDPSGRCKEAEANKREQDEINPLRFQSNLLSQ